MDNCRPKRSRILCGRVWQGILKNWSAREGVLSNLLREFGFHIIFTYLSSFTNSGWETPLLFFIFICCGRFPILNKFLPFYQSPIGNRYYFFLLTPRLGIAIIVRITHVYVSGVLAPQTHYNFPCSPSASFLSYMYYVCIHIQLSSSSVSSGLLESNT